MKVSTALTSSIAFGAIAPSVATKMIDIPNKDHGIDQLDISNVLLPPPARVQNVPHGALDNIDHINIKDIGSIGSDFKNAVFDINGQQVQKDSRAEKNELIPSAEQSLNVRRHSHHAHRDPINKRNVNGSPAVLASSSVVGPSVDSHTSLTHLDTHSSLAFNSTLDKCKFPVDAGLVSVTPNKPNAGWAMSPDQQCLPGKYCPYACPPGQIMAQWDPEATSYTYPLSMNGGLFCDQNGNIQKPFPDKPYCVPGTGASTVRNLAGGVVSFCQTVLPGNEAMLIPNEIAPASSAMLAVPDISYWLSTAAHYYINTPGVPASEACVWGTKDSPIGNWSPYVAGTNTDASGKTFVKLGWNPVYLESASFFHDKLPAFGIRLVCEGNCLGLPCALDPGRNGVNEETSNNGAYGAGGADFCVGTAELGSKLHIEVFDVNGNKTDPHIQSSLSTHSTVLNTLNTTALPTSSSSLAQSNTVVSKKESAHAASTTVYSLPFSSSTNSYPTITQSKYKPYISSAVSDSVSFGAHETSSLFTKSFETESEIEMTQAQSSNDYRSTDFANQAIYPHTSSSTTYVFSTYQEEDFQNSHKKISKRNFLGIGDDDDDEEDETKSDGSTSRQHHVKYTTSKVTSVYTVNSVISTTSVTVTFDTFGPKGKLNTSSNAVPFASNPGTTSQPSFPKNVTKFENSLSPSIKARSVAVENQPTIETVILNEATNPSTGSMSSRTDSGSVNSSSANAQKLGKKANVVVGLCIIFILLL